ncbi:SH3 domain-containing protein [Thioclava atlantica]|uniref:Aspartyl-trna synthetase n=1 Tax=Thioclava atlantica TaxID=1317124 RepID=A0A085U193_9RHOB|nr:SH3 domain-containing protein [Thioclava atlantica]KFE36740.1 hypothetical protein DW2_01240 [Thioclava atlantica]
MTGGKIILAAVSGIAILAAAVWSVSGANATAGAKAPPTTAPPPAAAAGKTASTAVSDTSQIQLVTPTKRGPVTHLPLPRYVSLKGSRGNARRGPSLSHRIDWVFTHPGMPLKVTAEYGHWRRVEDSEGQGGWIHYSLLSGVRRVIVTQDMVALHSRPDEKSEVTAKAQLGAIARLGACNHAWCEIEASGADGWLPKTDLWGVDPDEVRD